MLAGTQAAALQDVDRLGLLEPLMLEHFNLHRAAAACIKLLASQRQGGLDDPAAGICSASCSACNCPSACPIIARLAGHDL